MRNPRSADRWPARNDAHRGEKPSLPDVSHLFAITCPANGNTARFTVYGKTLREALKEARARQRETRSIRLTGTVSRSRMT